MVDYKISRTGTEESKRTIQRAIEGFKAGTIFNNSLRLFNALGYNTERQNPLDEPTFTCLDETYGIGNRINTEKALVNQWQEVHLLFQLTEGEMNRQMGLFDSGRVDNTIIEAYLFFAIQLKPGQAYSRTKLAEITRELNRA
ncbi:hypothetical protein LC612_38150, partial [Nostoc sp. CHAB 5834]|nr:hypothetical protein [Nostoc sp. CHAB 5834]